jgi:hypothetical protein
MICRLIDDRVVGSGTGLFLVGGHRTKILPRNSKGAIFKCVYCVQCTLFPLWLKFVPDRPAISVSTTVKSWAYDKVWLNVLYFTASNTTWLREMGREGVAFPFLDLRAREISTSLPLKHALHYTFLSRRAVTHPEGKGGKRIQGLKNT